MPRSPNAAAPCGARRSAFSAPRPTILRSTATSRPALRSRREAAMIAYEVFAIRYATLERRTNDNFVLRDLHDGPMPLDYFVWLIRGHGRMILVDTGFDEPAAQARGRNLLIHPTAALRAFGVEPDAIQDVILTHLHYDHAGNLGRFPNAVFQDRKSTRLNSS